MEDVKCIDGYKNIWCPQKNCLGGGVDILTSDKLTVTKLTSHTTSTFSAVLILLHLLNVPVIVGCVYHPPNADNNTTLNYLALSYLWRGMVRRWRILTIRIQAYAHP